MLTACSFDGNLFTFDENQAEEPVPQGQGTFPTLQIPYPAKPVETATTAVDIQTYTLGAGDRISVTTFDEDNLSDDFLISDNGSISMPLIGNIIVKELNLTQASALIEEKLKDGYLVDPRVSIQILQFRPIYLIGEVNQPGRYPYSDGLTLLNAIALSGGFTYRADKDDIEIRRGDSIANVEAEDGLKILVQPGDVIQVNERFF